ncbi:MAG: glucose-1-phosphate thymidylyltransferase [Actinobacteria bacterium]|nr:glucose-1-phosphate thymidylyltransferase [Actinomycetota bacterium]
MARGTCPPTDESGEQVRGIVLAGGGGSRLYPATKSVSKQLLAVYDKPMIYYPIWTLVTGGIREILIISTPRDLPAIEALLGDGASLGLALTYAVQTNPGGIAEAFLIGKEFIGDQPVTLILGDNLFIGEQMSVAIEGNLATFSGGAQIYLKEVPDPERFGVAEIGPGGTITSIVEKPEAPRSNLAITGLYTYGPDVVSVAERLPRSARNELEITDINAAYLDAGTLRYSIISHAVQWIDAGTPDALVAGSLAVQTATRDQASELGYVEIAAYRRGYLTRERLLAVIDQTPSDTYAERLRLAVESAGR